MLVNLIIDRQKPEVFGVPFPLDDVYEFSQNDIIGVAYNEPINCTNAAVTMIDIVQGDTIPLSINALTCFDNTIDILPPSFVERDPSVYRVVIDGIEDLHDNVADEYRWVFIVGDFDFEEAACLPELQIGNNNSDQDAISISAYRALKIITDGMVPDFGEVSLVAQQDIVFNPGFTVSKGGSLVAEIEQCDAPITCESISSLAGLGNAPDESIRFEIVENESCIEGVLFEENIQTNDIVVEINDFVTFNDPSQVNVTVNFRKPLNSGTISENVVLNNNGIITTVNLGTYNGVNGAMFELIANLVYEDKVTNGVTNHLVSTIVVMSPL